MHHCSMGVPHSPSSCEVPRISSVIAIRSNPYFKALERFFQLTCQCKSVGCPKGPTARCSIKRAAAGSMANKSQGLAVNFPPVHVVGIHLYKVRSEEHTSELQ